ncbi:hypothetical protein HWV62_43503 [Athelia sp. TMB]|nr:hypothetical protein HWV62_43503 [Athelia sp. TMB]
MVKRVIYCKAKIPPFRSDPPHHWNTFARTTETTLQEAMDAYIASNSPDLATLLSRTSLSDRDSTAGAEPLSSPAAYYQHIHRKSASNGSSRSRPPASSSNIPEARRTPASNRASRSQPQDSPGNSSDYSDSSFDRSIANLTVEEWAVLNGEKIVEILTDSSDDEPDELTSRSPSPTLLAVEFSRNADTGCRKLVIFRQDGEENPSPEPSRAFTNGQSIGLSEPIVRTQIDGEPFSQNVKGVAPTPARTNLVKGAAQGNTSSSVRPGTSNSSARPGTSLSSTRPGTFSSRSRSSRPTPFTISSESSLSTSGGSPSSPAPTSPSASRNSASSAITSRGPSPPAPEAPPPAPQGPVPAALANRPIYRISTPRAANDLEGWDDLKPFVDRVSCPNVKGYDTVAEAQAAYMIGYSLGLVKAVDDAVNAGRPEPVSLVVRNPTHEQIYDALERSAPNFLGREWSVVFRGVRPGIYPSCDAKAHLRRNFVSGIVSGISTAVYEKFSTREEAEARWEEALRAGTVETLLPGVSYVRQD